LKRWDVLAREIGFAERKQRLVVDIAVALYGVAILELANGTLCVWAEMAVNRPRREAFLLQRLLYPPDLILVQRRRISWLILCSVAPSRYPPVRVTVTVMGLDMTGGLCGTRSASQRRTPYQSGLTASFGSSMAPEVDSLCLVCRNAKVGSAVADDARLWFAGRGKLQPSRCG